MLRYLRKNPGRNCVLHLVRPVLKDIHKGRGHAIPLINHQTKFQFEPKPTGGRGKGGPNSTSGLTHEFSGLTHEFHHKLKPTVVSLTNSDINSYVANPVFFVTLTTF